MAAQTRKKNLDGFSSTDFWHFLWFFERQVPFSLAFPGFILQFAFFPNFSLYVDFDPSFSFNFQSCRFTFLDFFPLKIGAFEYHFA